MPILTPVNQNGDALPAFLPGGTVLLPITSSSVPLSLAPGAGTYELWPNVDCHIAIGPDPVATPNHQPFTGRVPRVIMLRSTDRIAAIKANGASDGILWITKARETDE